MILKLRHIKTSRFIVFMDQALVSGSNFLMGIILTRILGLDGYGEFALLWLVLLFCSSLHQAWIITPMYTLIAKKDHDGRIIALNNLLVHQMIFSVLMCAFTSIFLLGAKVFLSGWDFTWSLILIMSVTVFNYLMYDYARRISYVLDKPFRAFIINVLIYATQFAGIAFYIGQSRLTLLYALMVMMFSFAIGIPFSFPVFNARYISKNEVRHIFKAHFKFSKWLLGTSVLQWFSGNYFILAGASILGPTAVGALRILQNIMGVLHVVFLALENSIPLKAADLLKHQGFHKMLAYIRSITIKGLLLTALVGLLLSIFGSQIISLLYDSSYTTYAYLLYGFTLLYVLVYLGTNLRFVIRTLEQTKAIFIAYVLSTIFSAVSANLIVKQYQLSGIVAGLIITQIIMIACFIFYVYQAKNEYEN